jgi:LPXTG-site transpeptidase (sortase) family protein
LRRSAAVYLAALALLLSACQTGPPNAVGASARTALPTWTLPFSVATSTTAPATRPALAATPEPTPDAPPTTTQPAVEPTVAPTQAPPTLAPTPLSPPRLVIPHLELDTEIEDVGILDGAWDLTQLDKNVGWLTTTGQRPGDELAVVLVGHITTGPGQYGPFAGIGQLTAEHQIIYRWAGQDYVYQMRSQRLADDEDVQALYVPDGGKLLLVTCTSFNYITMRYQRRLILTAEWIGTVASQ